MIEVIGPINSGIASGGAGVATANATHPVPVTGKLLGFQIRYNDSPPATTDVIITTTNGVMPDRPLLTKSNAAADDFFPVRHEAIDETGTAIVNSNAYVPLVRDQIKVQIDQANDGDSIDVWAVVDKD